MGLLSKLFGMVVLAGGLGLVAFFLAQGLQDVSLEEFRVTGIKSVSADSFTFTGTIALKNPSKTTIPIESIQYDLILKDTGDVISTGSIPSFALQSSAVSRSSFEQRVRFAPAAQTVTRLLTQDKVLVIMRGIVTLDLPQPVDIPFSDEFDIREALLPQSPTGLSPDSSGSNSGIVGSVLP